MRTKSAVPLFSSKSWLLSTSFTNFDSEDKYLWRRTSHFIVVTACLPRLRQSYVCGGVLISRLKGFSLGVCIYFASFFNFVLWSWSKSIEANKYPLTLSVLQVNRTIADTISPSNAVRVPLERAQYKLIEDSCLIWLHRYKKMFQLRISDISQRQSNYLLNLIYNPDISLVKKNS